MKMTYRVEYDNAAFNFTLRENEYTCVFEGDAVADPWPPEVEALWNKAYDEFVDAVANELKLVELTKDGPREIPTSLEHRRAVAREACEFPETIIRRSRQGD